MAPEGDADANTRPGGWGFVTAAGDDAGADRGAPMMLFTTGAVATAANVVVAADDGDAAFPNRGGSAFFAGSSTTVVAGATAAGADLWMVDAASTNAGALVFAT